VWCWEETWLPFIESRDPEGEVMCAFCVCMYVHIYVHVYMYIFMYIHVYAYVYVCIRMYINVCVCGVLGGDVPAVESRDPVVYR